MASESAEAQPEVTRAASQPSSSAIRLPTASCRSSMRTILARGDLHRRHDLGPHQRAGQGRERAGRVDERPDAQLLRSRRARGAALLGDGRGAAGRAAAGRARRRGPTERSVAWSGSRAHLQPPRVTGDANADSASRAGRAPSRPWRLAGHLVVQVEPAVAGCSSQQLGSGRRWSSGCRPSGDRRVDR